MRRTIPVLVIALVIGLLAAPAMAKKYTNFGFPRFIEEGQKKTTVVVRNCWSESGYVAKVNVKVKDSEGHLVRNITKLADDDGKTPVGIGTRRLPVGRYKITVKCIHVFDGGGKGTWFKESGRFRVVPPS